MLLIAVPSELDSAPLGLVEELDSVPFEEGVGAPESVLLTDRDGTLDVVPSIAVLVTLSVAF